MTPAARRRWRCARSPAAGSSSRPARPAPGASTAFGSTACARSPIRPRAAILKACTGRARSSIRPHSPGMTGTGAPLPGPPRSSTSCMLAPSVPRVPLRGRRRGSGYDGVLPYAPQGSYGTPQQLKALIAAAHRCGLAMLLDVVYNHFGPEGNYLHWYAPQFFSERHVTPWGRSEEHTSELQSRRDLVCRLLLEK